MAVSEQLLTTLLAAVRSELLITWVDTATDNRLKGYIKSGIRRLQEIAGANLDFTEGTAAYELLMARCRYANSQALEVFEANYRADLLELNLRIQAPLAAHLYDVENAETAGEVYSGD